MTGSELAAITGLTTGAITGVVARLEQVGWVRRERVRHDRRMQILHPEREHAQRIRRVFEPIHREITETLNGFDAHQLSAIAEFLERSTDILHRHVALLRADTLRLESNRKPRKRNNETSKRACPAFGVRPGA